MIKWYNLTKEASKMKRKPFLSLGILLCIALLALTVVHQAESARYMALLIDIAAMGDLVILALFYSMVLSNQ